jgi:hypothetical protein
MGMRRLQTSIIASLALSSCLVADPRPEPGSVLITASSDDALRSGFITADGWTVRYERFLASIGNTSPEGDQCTFYSDTAYNRVLNMLVPGPQKVSIIYALGSCSLDFEVSNPSSDSVLGAMVTSADRELMRTPGSDPEATESGMSLFVQGTATGPGGRTKRFTWAFRHRLELTGCSSVVNGAVVNGVTLRSGEQASRNLLVSGEALFQGHLGSEKAPLFFDPFAAADGDNDDVITLDELDAVTLTSISRDDRYADRDPEWASLGEYVYLGLSTNVVRYEERGTCEEKVVLFNDQAPH